MDHEAVGVRLHKEPKKVCVSISSYVRENTELRSQFIAMQHQIYQLTQEMAAFWARSQKHPNPSAPGPSTQPDTITSGPSTQPGPSARHGPAVNLGVDQGDDMYDIDELYNAFQQVDEDEAEHARELDAELGIPICRGFEVDRNPTVHRPSHVDDDLEAQDDYGDDGDLAEEEDEEEDYD